LELNTHNLPRYYPMTIDVGNAWRMLHSLFFKGKLKKKSRHYVATIKTIQTDHNIALTHNFFI
jgi:hypothetical protein